MRHIALVDSFFGETFVPKVACRPWDQFRFLVEKLNWHDQLPVKSWTSGASLVYVPPRKILILLGLCADAPPQAPLRAAPGPMAAAVAHRSSGASPCPGPKVGQRPPRPCRSGSNYFVCCRCHHQFHKH